MQMNFISMLWAGVFVTLNFCSLAQKDSSGIYRTADDFKNQKLSYAINYKTEKHKINDNLLLNDRQIKVKHHDTIYTLEKNSTYGYKSTKGEVFRFENNKEYKVLNPVEKILVYQYSVMGHPENNPKGSIVEDYYFFATDAANSPVELTKENLKKAFPENHKFHDALDENFKTDKELLSYDKFHHMYKLNWLLQQSSK